MVGIDQAASEEVEAEEAQAPAVVAVVVTRDPGPWFEACLAALGAQDYPNLSVLVIDAASATEVLPRVAAQLPTAYVRRIETNPGFGPAANDVLEVVDGATFYAFCHDDVVLEPSAMRVMVEEAFRSNAGIAGPKLVAWDAPGHLLQVGMAADKGGVLAPLVERGELDQEQHDGVRDVFVIPGACTLVRADLFATIGGFDPAIELLGEDLDLCWRAQVAGARVVVVPTARARHRETLAGGIDVEDARAQRNRNRMRSVFVCYSRTHLVRVLPHLALLSLLELGYCIAMRRRAQARGVVAAWSANLRDLTTIRERRRQLHEYRRFPDSEVRALQVHGSIRLRRFVRGELDTHGISLSVSELEHEIEEAVQSPSRRLELAAAAFALLVFLVGTRQLLVGRLPAVSGFVPFDEGPTALFREYLSGWRAVGLGGAGPAPSALLLLALAGLPLLGAMGVLQHLLVLGMVPLGIAGVWRLTRLVGSPAGRAAGVVLYAVSPLAWNSISGGGWAVLILYAVSPWVLAVAAGAGADALGDPAPGEIARPTGYGGLLRAHGQRPTLVRASIALGIPMAVLAAFVPLAPLVFLVVAVALLIGDLVVGRPGASLRVLPLVAGSAVVAFVLHLPWSLDLVLPGAEWGALGGVAPLGRDAISASDAMRFATGPYGHSLLGWAVPAAAVLALLIGRDWRWRWAVRCWVVALACWALAWVAGQGHLGGMPPAGVLLAPAAAALALAAALGVAAFERDLSALRFGWPQAASIATGVALLLASLPTLLGMFDGRWKLADVDHAAGLAFLPQDVPGSYRVLWIGASDVLPVAGRPLRADVSYALTTDGTGRMADRWASPAYGSTTLVDQALRAAVAGRTDRLGRILGTFGVRYVVLVERAAPARTHARRVPLPAGTAATFDRQLDLRPTALDDDVTLYENAAWSPVVAAVPATAADLVERPSAFGTAVSGDLPVGQGVLRPDGDDRMTGTVDGQVVAAWSSDARWRLTVDGARRPRSVAYGWANTWAAGAGKARLSYATSPARPLAVAVQLALWVAAVALLVRWRRRTAVVGHD